MSEAKNLLIGGLWKNNSALVQLLGLCPLLAVTSTATNALDLGLATTLVLTITNSAISASRRWVPGEIRIPIYVMIIASVVSCVQMLINAYAYGLYQSLGIFIPLIVTNCIVVGRAEAVASKSSIPLSALDGFAIGMGATCTMVTLGSIRELIGNGTLFNGADQLLGPWAKALRIEVVHFDSPMLLAMLPPGAFIGLGMLLAGKYLIDQKNEAARRTSAGRFCCRAAGRNRECCVNKDKRLQILTRLRDANPHPTTELNFSSPFELLIAVLLSAQATDVSVNKATARLYPVANTPAAMLALGVEGVKEYIKTIGLFNSKAENVIKICRILLEQHGGVVPEDRAALEALPGVGRKTANVVLNTAFGWPIIAVDTHIFRVSNRTRFAPGKNVEEVEQKLLKVVPADFKVDCHHWLILHGRYTCVARKPRCGSCLIEDLCEFTEKTD
ncbi:endonuclease III [Plautia stali symbiont]|nr:endonuclease III [Plautia stali symbiont]